MNIETFLHKRTLTIYWIVLLVHCTFQYFVLPYRAITKPLLVPLLLLYLLMNDSTIGKPIGKSVFYIGLFLAFFGDVLLILINDTFFLSGMIAFMLMNLFYGASFLYLNRLHVKKLLPVIVSAIILFAVGYWLYHFLGDEMGDYKMPIFAYMITLGIMICLAVNVAGNGLYTKVALTYLIPGTVIFLIENILVAVNKFHLGNDKNVYIAVMLTYGSAQYLIVKGILKAYPSNDHSMAYSIE